MRLLPLLFMMLLFSKRSDVHHLYYLPYADCLDRVCIGQEVSLFPAPHASSLVQP